jgi:hypothetical protein
VFGGFEFIPILAIIFQCNCFGFILLNLGYFFTHVTNAANYFHNKALQHRSASLHWTAFKSRLCGFATQKFSTKPQLKSCR